MKEIKWFSPDSSDGERSLKQHAFISVTRKRPWTHEEYEGNQALCNRKAGVMNENEEFEPIENIDSEPRSESCCKICAMVAKKLKG